MQRRDFTPACSRCFRFNGYNPDLHGSFCSVGCQIEYSEKGSLIREGALTEDEAWEIYKKSQDEVMERYRKSREQKRKK